ncbi:MAG TPA: carboxypeptidase-like regulatory domain-containing protein [Candidatus Acidoferrales bacterium]|nr:carboxypeptidase-like regulatory domain-containing protein [Candidatus Acidoferrales bacterium]
MILRTIRALSLGLLVWCAAALSLAAAPQQAGKISGVVVDPSGTPQLGATVLIASEQINDFAPMELLTNASGVFSSASLRPGLYSVRATLAGFLPAIEQHIQVSAQHTTLLEIELGSVFASFSQLRRQPSQPAASNDEFTWVLRTSSSTRPILRFDDGEVVFDGEESRSEAGRKNQPHGVIELTTGSRHPGSVSNISNSPATAFAYDQNLGGAGRLLMAGQFSYQDEGRSGGFATVWIPAGESGPVTTLVVRESRFGTDGTGFRGMRLDHDSQMTIGQRVSVRYGAEFMLAGIGETTSSLRPRGQVTVQLNPEWHVAFILAARPWPGADAGSLQGALDSLDAFPTLLIRNGQPALENGWHEEVALEHSLGPRSSLTASAFHDGASNTAVFGRGSASGANFLQDPFSNGFAYDGGDSNSWGARVAYRQKLSDVSEVTIVYAWAGALAPEAATGAGDLRELLETSYRHSLAARLSSRLPRVGTQFTLGYKWISGNVVSRLDAYGESAYGLDPNLNFLIRQPLPGPLHMAALVDVGNLLAQGYVPVTTQDGRLLLVPSYRSFRGGLSLQF